MLLKPKNPMGLLVHKRKAGVHGKTTKATRRKEKIELLREFGRVVRHQTFNLYQKSSNLLAPTSCLFI